jgi:Ca2+-binding RTX toxin-like protein
MFWSWLLNLAQRGGIKVDRKARKNNGPKFRARLLAEALEERATPATSAFFSIVDHNNPSSSTISVAQNGTFQVDLRISSLSEANPTGAIGAVPPITSIDGLNNFTAVIAYDPTKFFAQTSEVTASTTPFYVGGSNFAAWGVAGTSGSGTMTISGAAPTTAQDIKAAVDPGHGAGPFTIATITFHVADHNHIPTGLLANALTIDIRDQATSPTFAASDQPTLFGTQILYDLSGTDHSTGSQFTASDGTTQTATISPTGAVETGTTATITTLAAHNLQPGQVVTISGVGNSGYNGTFRILAVPSPNSFTYTAPPALPASGNGTVTYGNAITSYSVNGNTMITAQSPTLFLGGPYTGGAGGTVVVPVNIDNTDPFNSTTNSLQPLTSIGVALLYDPAVLSIAPPITGTSTDVTLGSIVTAANFSNFAARNFSVNGDPGGANTANFPGAFSGWAAVFLSLNNITANSSLKGDLFDITFHINSLASGSTKVIIVSNEATTQPAANSSNPTTVNGNPPITTSWPGFVNFPPPVPGLPGNPNPGNDGVTNVDAIINISGNTISVFSGSPQSTTVNTAFAAPLVVKVVDGASNPISGALVTFTAPGASPSGLFSNSTHTISATTAANGQLSEAFTADTGAGTYVVTASISGSTTSFTLTNIAGAPTTITVTSGSGQSATVTTAFTNPLVVTVSDTFGNLVSGAAVTFAKPGSGPSATPVTSTTTTAANGQTSDAITANTIAGTYSVTASSGTATPATFTETNVAGAATSIVVTAGSGQSATVNTAFANPLVAKVTDTFGNAVSGAAVTFTKPASGPSATPQTSTATTGSNGQASDAITANTIAGTYGVTASTPGAATPASFSETNVAGAATSITTTSGSGQTTTVNTAFGAPLVATVKDTFGNLVSGAAVTFTKPGSGPSATPVTSTSTTGANGQASDAITANTLAGNYTVTANTPGAATPATFSENNVAGAAKIITVTSGNNQTTTVNTSYASPIVATVTDTFGNPVSGASVTFGAVPAGNGSSATYPVVGNPAISGINGQVSITPVANTIANLNTASAPTYTLTATVAGVATPANFTESNKAATAAGLAVTVPTPTSNTAPTTFTVDALDGFGNRNLTYTDTSSLNFTTTNTVPNTAPFSNPYSLSSGHGSFSVTFPTLGPGFTVSATDPIFSTPQTSNAFTVTGTIPNLPPTSTPPTLSALNEDDVSIPVTLTAQDPDPQNTTLTFTITALPLGGTLLYNTSNTTTNTNLPVYLGQQFTLPAIGTAIATLNLRYLPGGRYAGGTAQTSPDQFNYAVTDSPFSGSSPTTNTIARHVNITVNPVPAAHSSLAAGTGTTFLVATDGMYTGANNVLYIYGSTAGDAITVTGTPAAGFTIKRVTGAITTNTLVLPAQSSGIQDVRIYDLGSNLTGETLDVSALNVRSLLVGGAGTQTFKGSAQTSIEYGRGTTDILYGGAADDFVYGGDGTNTIYGQAGNDILSGGAGNNVISGGTGNNFLYGGSNGGNNNLVYGNSTTTDAAPFANTLIITGADAMNETAYLGGNPAATVLVPITTSAQNASAATANSDAIPANPLKLGTFAQGNKSINGAGIFNANGQALFGGTQPSGVLDNTFDFRNMTFKVGGVTSVPYIDTGAGNDTLFASNDGLDLRGEGTGNKTFTGGSGGDTFDVRGGLGLNKLQGGSGNDTFFVNGNSLANDTLIDGGGGANVIKNVGADGLVTGAGTPLHMGRDSIPATSDVILKYFGPAATLPAGQGTVGINPANNLGSNIQTFDVSGFGIDGITTAPVALNFRGISFKVGAATTLTQITGSPFNDAIAANNEGLTILGLAGNDTLIGGTGGDTLEGGTGADTLVSNGGNDNLYGWDIANLGVSGHNDGGRDTFILNTGGTGAPTIWDFDSVNDVIDLRGFRSVSTSSMVLSFTTPPPSLAPNTVYASQDTVIPADTLLTLPTGQALRIKNLVASPTTLRTTSTNGLVNLML